MAEAARRLRCLTRQAFLEMFHPDTHETLQASAAEYPDAEAFVVFENQNIGTPFCGDQTAVVVGPRNTFKSVEEASRKHWGNLPSNRQVPIAYCMMNDFLEKEDEQ